MDGRVRWLEEARAQAERCGDGRVVIGDTQLGGVVL